MISDFLTVAWALRWVIAGLAIAMAAAVPIARHMERDRRLIADLTIAEKQIIEILDDQGV